MLSYIITYNVFGQETKNPNFLVDTIEYVSYSQKDHYDGTIELLHKEFYRYEVTCAAVNLESDLESQLELDELVRNVLRDGVSIVAVEKSTGKVVGAAINKIQVFSFS